LFASGAMDEINPNPSQNDMASKAISTLNKNSKGFFIMCESTGADHGGHGNNPGMVVSGVKLLDAALNTALDFARKDGNTLIVVTADHETGGLSVTNADEQNPAFKASWGTNGHTANMVPIYAYGPGAEKFTGTHQNTDIPRIFAELWGRELNNK